MNKCFVCFGELCEILVYMIVAFLAVVSWTGLLLVVGVVLGPEYPGIANNIAICMALLQVIGIVFFGFKVVGRKKGVV